MWILRGHEGHGGSRRSLAENSRVEPRPLGKPERRRSVGKAGKSLPGGLTPLSWSRIQGDKITTVRPTLVSCLERGWSPGSPGQKAVRFWRHSAHQGPPSAPLRPSPPTSLILWLLERNKFNRSGNHGVGLVSRFYCYKYSDQHYRQVRFSGEDAGVSSIS